MGAESLLRKALGIPFVRFVLVGGSGAALNLAITFLLTRFVFGLSGYFTAYLIGTGANLLYNFILYTRTVFKTTDWHLVRLTAFSVYSLLMASLQAFLVHLVTPLVGLSWYLAVIIGIIALGAIVNFFVFKFGVFRPVRLGQPDAVL